MVFIKTLKSLFAQLSIKDFFYILIILIFLVLLLRTNSCHSKNIHSNISLPSIESVVHKIDKKGTEFAEIKQTIYTQKDLDHLTDSFKKVLKVNKITSVTNSIEHLQGQVTTTNTIYLDTIKHTITDHYFDKNLKLGYSGDLMIKRGEFTWEFTPDTATYITSIKKHWFKSDEYSINIYHTNDYFTKSVVAGNSYSYRPPKVQFCIGPNFGVSYSLVDKKIHPFIGFGVSYNLIGIKRKD